MRALLLADPPAGDKVARELEALGVEVDYRRGAKDQAMMVAVDRPGYAWAIVMNGHSLGAALKNAAKKQGARYSSVPPGWSAARIILEHDGFFEALKAQPNGALKDRPFARLLPAAAEAAEPPKPPQSYSQALKEILADPRAATTKPLPEKPLEPGEMRYEVTVVSDSPPPADEPPSCGVVADAALVEQARAAFTKDPDLPGTSFIDGLRATGLKVGYVTCAEIFRVRRAIRRGLGLNPSSARRAPAARTVVDVAEAFRRIEVTRPAETVRVDAGSAPLDQLPGDILTACELLAQAIRAAALEGEVTVTHSGDVAFDVARRQHAQGRTKVDAVGGPR